MNKIKEAFQNVTAGEELKEKTLNNVLDELSKAEAKGRSVKQRRFAVAAVCIVFVFASVAFGGYRVYAKPVSYITVDVDSSVELGINRWGKVVATDSFNSEGEDLLRRNDVEGEEYQNALKRLFSDDEMIDSCKSGEEFLLSVLSEDEDIKKDVENICSGYGMRYNCQSANRKDREQSRKENISTGKYCHQKNQQKQRVQKQEQSSQEHNSDGQQHRIKNYKTQNHNTQNHDGKGQMKGKRATN